MKNSNYYRNMNDEYYYKIDSENVHKGIATLFDIPNTKFRERIIKELEDELENDTITASGKRSLVNLYLFRIKMGISQFSELPEKIKPMTLNILNALVNRMDKPINQFTNDSNNEISEFIEKELGYDTEKRKFVFSSELL